MLIFSQTQMASISRQLVCSRVSRFIAACCHRDDFKAWALEPGRLTAIWHPLWPACHAHSEHDLALTMVVLAVASHERIGMGDPVAVLGGVASNEVRLKDMLATRHYFDFTAFDLEAA